MILCTTEMPPVNTVLVSHDGMVLGVVICLPLRIIPIKGAGTRDAGGAVAVPGLK